MKVYIIGSLRNADVRELAARLRADGHDVFDDWHAAGERADDEWTTYYRNRGFTMQQAIQSSFVKHIFDYDKKWLDWCDVAVLMLPAGRSGHLELGYIIGSGKPGIIYMDADHERWDAMYRFAYAVVKNEQELAQQLALLEPPPIEGYVIDDPVVDTGGDGLFSRGALVLIGDDGTVPVNTDDIGPVEG